jgi:hypothetical protein
MIEHEEKIYILESVRFLEENYIFKSKIIKKGEKITIKSRKEKYYKKYKQK